ncbi:hypothetical protein YC2023_075543 [Brassica napus]
MSSLTYEDFTTICAYVELTSVMFKSLESETPNPNPIFLIFYFIYSKPHLYFHSKPQFPHLLIHKTNSHITLFIKQTPHYLIHKTNSLILFIKQIHQSDTSTFSSSLETSSFSLNSSSTASSVASSVRSLYS